MTYGAKQFIENQNYRDMGRNVEFTDEFGYDIQPEQILSNAPFKESQFGDNNWMPQDLGSSQFGDTSPNRKKY